MQPALDALPFPELIFGLTGPIGVDMEALTDSLGAALRDVGYAPRSIKLTDEMLRFPLSEPLKPPTEGYFESVKFKIRYANALRKQEADCASLARLAMKAVRENRRIITGHPDTISDKGQAYILQQLKRPEEISLLRQVYGQQFVLISAYGSIDVRQRLIESQLKLSLPTKTPDHQIRGFADELIEIDADEKNESFGQRLRDCFHLGDVFVDGTAKQEMDKTITRFTNALFGHNDITPSKAEYGMYAAKSASLRSADLSRQVGAAIFTDDGELLSQGCNEVPKAFGGTYWDSEEPDFRDVRIGYDPNDQLRRELLRDLFERLFDEGWLSPVATSHGNPTKMVEAATRKSFSGPAGEQQPGPLAVASVMDLTEYGRIVHAEMCAICDAARIGRALKGSTLYCTVFPCHNCTKHIIASGIKRVIYVEPYPKSRAKDLHGHEITIEKDDPIKVSFVPFLGISPLRYRDIFQKNKRKDGSGQAQRWYGGKMRPMIDILAPFYVETEAQEAVKAFSPTISCVKS